MNNLERDRIEISVIVPVYQTDPNLIEETFRSLVHQTLEKNLYEIIVVDDNSTSRKTCDFIEKLAQSDTLEGVPLTVLRHKTNMWLAEVRNTGAKHARGEFLCFLDSDDLIDSDYLKKAILALRSHRNAAWAYPAVNDFGIQYKRVLPRDFNPFAFYFRNPMVNASVVRRSCWEALGGQRAMIVTGDIKFYEDWDFWIRAMARGYYGVPLSDTTFYYRRHAKSMITRGVLLHYLSAYVVWRKNIFRLPFLFVSQRNYRRNCFPDQRLRNLPVKLVSKILGRFLPYKLQVLPISLLLDGVFRPTAFVEKCLSGKYLPTTAEVLSGFSKKPKLAYEQARPSKKNKKAIFFAHYWWRLGGAERVLLDWIQSARSIDNVRLFDIAYESVTKDEFFKESFDECCDEQFTIDRLGVSAETQLALCWELFRKERPKILMIMSNPFFYVLAPKIKEFFPETIIMDLLHNEEYGKWSWFSVSKDYERFLDQRIVISDFWRDILVEKYEAPSGKVAVVENGISLKQFNPEKIDKSAARESLGIPQDVFVVGFIGRLDDQKNPLLFTELADYCRDDKRLFFVVVGNGVYEKTVVSQLDASSNGKQFSFTDTPQLFYRAFDMLVCPSKFEGYPLVGIEAAAMKVPIIATDIPGFREQIDKGKFGFLYKPIGTADDIKNIYEIIDNYISKPSLDLDKGRAFVEQYHDIAKKRLSHEELFEKFLN